jgi:hypothetical protein
MLYITQTYERDLRNSIEFYPVQTLVGGLTPGATLTIIILADCKESPMPSTRPKATVRLNTVDIDDFTHSF